MPRLPRPRHHEKNGPSDVLAADVGARIRHARIGAGFTLAELGGEELSRSFLSLVETGKTRISLRSLAYIAQRLQKPISYFFKDDYAARALAAEYILSEAEAALCDSRPDDAVRLLDAEDLPEEALASALWLRGWAALQKNQYREAVGPLQDALALVRPQPTVQLEPDDQELAIEISYRLGRALYEDRRYEDAEEAFGAGLQLSRRAHDESMEGRFLVMLGHLCTIRNEYDRAISQYQAARPHLEDVRDMDLLAALYSGFATVYWHSGDAKEAVKYSRLALGIYKARDRQYAVALALNNVAANLELMHDYREALSYAHQAVDRAVEIQAGDIEAFARSTLASILFALGDVDRAEDEAEGAEMKVSEEAESIRASIWLVQARIAAHKGQHAQADELFQRAIEVYDRLGEDSRYTVAAYAYTDALRARGDKDAALEWVDRIRAKAPSTHVRLLG